jgi:membrane protein YdbS with pleckstrin-like domain
MKFLWAVAKTTLLYAVDTLCLFLLYNWFIGEIDLIPFMGFGVFIACAAFVTFRELTFSVGLIRYKMVDLYMTSEEKEKTDGILYIAKLVIPLISLAMGYFLLCLK